MDIDDNTPIGHIMDEAQRLAEEAYPVIQTCEALTDAAKFGIFILLQNGDVDGFNWSEHVTKPTDPLVLDELEDELNAEELMRTYRRTEAILMSQLIAIRRGLVAAGTPMEEAPTALIAAIGRNA
jgi:hypothetical protein